MPYVNAWYQHYKDSGLVIIGVHSPEFEFEKDTDNVRKAVEKFGISYPVALDSNMAVWKAFNNRFWPAHYFVDAQGSIRGHHFGEGKYARSERTIRKLLTEAGAKNLPDPLDDAGGPGRLGGRRHAPTSSSPETYLGFARAENFQSPGSFARNSVKSYAAARQAGAESMGAGRSLEGRRAKKSALDARAGPRRVPLPRARPAPGAGAGPQNKTMANRCASASCSTASRRAPITAWTSTRTATARCASNACTSSSARRVPSGTRVHHRIPRSPTSRPIHSPLVRRA